MACPCGMIDPTKCACDKGKHKGKAKGKAKSKPSDAAARMEAIRMKTNALMGK